LADFSFHGHLPTASKGTQALPGAALPGVGPSFEQYIIGLSCSDYYTNISLEQQLALVMDGIIELGGCHSLCDGLPPGSAACSQYCPMGPERRRRESLQTLCLKKHKGSSSLSRFLVDRPRI
jgi:hypothetical protein